VAVGCGLGCGRGCRSSLGWSCCGGSIDRLGDQCQSSPRLVGLHRTGRSGGLVGGAWRLYDGFAVDRWIVSIDRCCCFCFCVVDSGSVGFRVGLVPGFSAGPQQQNGPIYQAVDCEFKGDNGTPEASKGDNNSCTVGFNALA